MTTWIEKNRGNKNGIGTGGIGYVVIPSNVEEIGEYVNQCYRSCEVTISGDGYGIMSHVKVAKDVMPSIQFPNGENGKGSLVVWLRESFYNRPIVVGILSDNNTPILQKGTKQSQLQNNQGVSVEVLTDAVNAIAQMYACGNSSKPARVVIKAAGSDEDEVDIQATKRIRACSSEFRVESTESFKVIVNNGEQELITIEGDEEKIHFLDYNGNEITINEIEDEEKELKKFIQIKDTFGRVYLFDAEKAVLKDQFGHVVTLDEKKAELKDQFDHVITFDEEKAHMIDKFSNEATFNQDNIQFKCAKFNVGDGSEPMVLGETLKGLLEDLISAITSITVPTPHGISGTPINSSQFSAINSRLKTMLSQLSNTD